MTTNRVHDTRTTETPQDFVRRSPTVRIFSGALGCENLVMDEGKVIGWLDHPSWLIQHADGSQTSWSARLPYEEIEPLPDRLGIEVTEQDMAEAREMLAMFTTPEDEHAFLTGYLGDALETVAAGGKPMVSALALYRVHRELAQEATP